MGKINDYIKLVREINLKNGWNVLRYYEWFADYKIPSILALIHSEVSEALEAFRKRDIDNFKEEIADIIIRCFDLAGGIKDMDLEAEIDKKLEKNRKRGFKHGGKKI